MKRLKTGDFDRDLLIRHILKSRCEDYAISLLEQCEDLREVEVFLQTRNSGNKDANYILAILDSRMKFVAHERFQYVLLKKFGKCSIMQDKLFFQTTIIMRGIRC